MPFCLPGGGVLIFGLVEDVPLAALDPYLCLGVIFPKICTYIQGLFQKKVPIIAILQQKHTKFSKYSKPPKILKIRPIDRDFLKWKMEPIFRHFWQKTDPFLQHIPVCRNMWVSQPPGFVCRCLAQFTPDWFKHIVSNGMVNQPNWATLKFPAGGRKC